MKKNNTPAFFLNMGTSSLLVIFLVLFLAIFATLSLSDAKGDYDASVQLAVQKQAYYDACATSELALARIDDILAQHHATSSSAKDYFDKIQSSLDNEINGRTIEYKTDNDTLLLSWYLPFTESKMLYVSVSVPYKPKPTDNHYYQILSWQTMPID